MLVLVRASICSFIAFRLCVDVCKHVCVYERAYTLIHWLHAYHRPVTLKMEKVYMGSVLLSKKRYVGFKFEDKDQKEGVFDAKGSQI